MISSIKINPVLPVSHQFENFSDEFISRFKSFEFRSADHLKSWASDALVHTGFSLVDTDFGEEINFEALKRVPIRRFSFDVGPCYQRTELIAAQYVGVGKKLSVKEVLSISYANLERVRNRFPKGCELAFENLNYYPTGAYDGVCEAEFCNLACRELGITMVLDVAHARVTASNLGYTFSKFLDQLDLDNISEIHLSRPEIHDNQLSLDRHYLPEDEEFYWLSNIVSRIKTKRSDPIDVVIEYYHDIDGIIQSYDRLSMEAANSKSIML